MKRIQLNGYEIYVDKDGIMYDDEGNSYSPPSGVKVSTGSYSGSKAKRIVSKYSKGEKRPPTARGGPTAAQVKASEIQARMNTYGAIWFWLERIKKHIGKEASSKDISFLDKVTKIAKNASEARGGKLTKQHKKGIISIHNKYKKLIPSSDSLKRWDSYLTVERKNNMKKSELRKIIIEEIENIVKEGKIRFDDSPYYRSHRKKPGGRSAWAFAFSDPLKDRDPEIWMSPGSTTIQDAKKKAAEEAKKRGVNTVWVMG